MPTHEPNYDEVGVASWYGPTFHGKDSASGERFDENAMTAAHPTLPIPSLVRVTNLENGRTVIVRLNDRGPFVDDRIIDLSKKAGEALEPARQRHRESPRAVCRPRPSCAQTRCPPSPLLSPPPLNTALPPAAARRRLPSLSPISRSRSSLLAGVEQRGYFLQAGSFADLHNAQALRDRLAVHGPVSLATARGRRRELLPA